MRVSNPTHKAKAVRMSDGLATIPPGASLPVDVEWTEAETARYVAAGLVIEADISATPIDALDEDGLRARILASGGKVDKRWGLDRLRAEAMTRKDA